MGVSYEILQAFSRIEESINLKDVLKWRKQVKLSMLYPETKETDINNERLFLYLSQQYISFIIYYFIMIISRNEKTKEELYYKLCSELNIDPLSQTQYTECDTYDILSYFQFSLKSFSFKIYNNSDPLLSLDLDNSNFYLIHQKQPFYIGLEIENIEINNLTNKNYPKLLYKDKSNLEVL